jgi:hypothetical protein
MRYTALRGRRAPREGGCLEPGIDPAVLEELDELDVRYLVVVYIDSTTDNRFWVAGLDGSLRQLE